MNPKIRELEAQVASKTRELDDYRLQVRVENLLCVRFTIETDESTLSDPDFNLTDLEA